MMTRTCSFAIVALGVTFLAARAQTTPKANAKRPIEEWIEDYKKKDTRANTQMRMAGESGLPYLAMLISHDDPEVRLRSYQHLGYLGPKAAPAIPQIVQNLDHPDSSVRLQSLHVLASIGYAAHDAEDDVIGFYQKAPDREKRWILRTLGFIGKDSKRIVPLARRHLADPESAAFAAVVLWRLDPTARGQDVMAPFLVAAPRRSNFDSVTTRQAVLMAPDYPEMASGFVPWLSELQGARRAAAYHALSEMGEEGRKQARLGIAEILKRDPKSVPRTEVSRTNASIESALAALVEYGFDDELLFRTLAQRLDEPMPRDLSTLLKGLQRLGPKAKALSPQLERALRDKKLKNLDGYEALAMIDPPAAAKFRSELEDLDRSDARKTIQAQAVLFRLESTSARLRPLIDAAKNRNHEALRQIARLGPAAREALPTLAALMDASAFDGMVAHAYVRTGGDAKRAAAAVVAAVNEAPNKMTMITQPGMRELLAELGPAAKGIVPALIAQGRQQGMSADWEEISRVLTPIDREALRRALRTWD